MNVDEVNGVMDLAVEELSMAQILYDAGKYRGSITHSYYAMFDAAKALLLTHDFISKKHDTILAQFSKDFVRDGDFSQEVYTYYSNAKKLRRKSSYDFSVNFDKQEAFDCLIQAEEFIIEAKKFL
ncbi:HEPN domain-containing protein [Methanobrevibacter sp. UBA212]|uniref:HEPN domain-containing protein n=1 Tax=Methanobrevibacter sp. UBA212 TaxID=1915476 RepID=UPI0025DA2894|nr:HEPN domain-containing protein [Methanobrevibacter sp. UBA212]